MPDEVSYEKSAGDLVDTYRDIFRAALMRRPVRRAATLAHLCLALSMAGWWINRHSCGCNAGDGDPFYFIAGGLLVMPPICWALSYASIPRRAHRLFAQRRTDDATWTWRWSEAGIEMVTGNSQLRYRWDELHRWMLGRRTVMFFLDDAHVLYLPRRVLSAVQVDDLTGLARRNNVPSP